MEADAPSESATTSLDDESIQVISSGSDDIRRFLAENPQGEGPVLGLLGRRLDGKIRTETWSLVYPSLVTLLGADGATLIGFAATADPSPIGEIGERAPEEVSVFIRRILANYGAELRDAYEQANELPHNWRTVYREVYRDLINNRPYIRIRIAKVNGEEAVIEGPGDGILTLASNLIVALNQLGSRDSFAEDRIEDFLGNVDTLLEILRPEVSVSATASIAAGNASATEARATGQD